MGELLYLYACVPSNEMTTLPDLTGFDGEGKLHTIQAGSITAVICSLNEEDYNEDVLKDKVENDMQWLQEKAFHHHETVLALSKLYTVIPLKFSTIYKSEDSLKQTLTENESKMNDIFDLLEGNEEWNLKIYCDDQTLKEQVSKDNPVIEQKRQEISQLSKGKQFFELKKLDKLVETELEEEKNRVSERVHEALKKLVLKGNVKRTWSSEVTGADKKMTWNSVYLISKEDVERFLEEVQSYDQEMKETGWQLEASGPWPAYHFSSFQT